MARRREDVGRLPQFTESHYEIPSWQTPWSKPWYQRTDSSNSASEKTRTYKYNSRGHLTDCNCSICEEDLETAFSPQSNSNQKTLFDIPKDRREEVKIQQFEEVENGGDEDSAYSSKTKPQNSTGSNFTSAGSADVPKRVYMFSDLVEVSQTTTSDGNNSETRSSSASLIGEERETTSAVSSNNTSSASHESYMAGFGNLTAIQAISDQSQDIQQRVRNYQGKSDTQEYRTMKELLVSLRRELNIINSSIEWVATTKAIALEAVEKTLHTLEQKVKDSES